MFTQIQPGTQNALLPTPLVSNDPTLFNPNAPEDDLTFNSLISAALVNANQIGGQTTGQNNPAALPIPQMANLPAPADLKASLGTQNLAQILGQNSLLTPPQTDALQIITTPATTIADLKAALQNLFGLTPTDDELILQNGTKISLDDLANNLLTFKRDPKANDPAFSLGALLGQGQKNQLIAEEVALTTAQTDNSSHSAQKIETLMTQLLTLQNKTEPLALAQNQNPQNAALTAQALQNNGKNTKDDITGKNIPSDKTTSLTAPASDNLNNALATMTAQAKNKNAPIIFIGKNTQTLSAEGAITSHSTALPDSLVKSVDMLNQQALNNYGQATKPSSTPLPQVVQTVSLQLIKGAQGKFDNFNIQLTPASLGTIEAKIKIQKDGSMRAHLIADSQDALNALQRDQNQLIDSLRQAGLDLKDDALSFDLKEHNQNSAFSHNDNHDTENSGTKHASYQNAQAITANLDIYTNQYLSQTGVNILV
jgi:hypothetical protein